MPTPMIGLDIGSTAVRAVEVQRTRSGSALRAVGQVGLPKDAVTDGEVTDVAAVAEALKRLWAEAGFSSRSVVLGASGQRVIVRQAEVPAMSAADFRSAVRFEAEQLIPLPVEETELGFSILGRDSGPNGPTMRVLLAAAHRDVIRGLLDATTAAGLSVEAIDVSALASLRAVHRSTGLPSDPAERDVLVSVGSTSTTVVVSEGRSAGFVRVISGGGATLTSGLASERELPWELAETAKRAVVPGRATILERAAEPLIADIAQSIDYFLAQHPDIRVRRVWVTGGGSLAAGFVPALAAAVDAQVDTIDGFAAIDTSALAGDPAVLNAASPLVLGAGGLAEWSAQEADERLSLLPEHVAARRAMRRDVRRAVVAVGGAAVILAAGWYLVHHRVVQEDQQAATYRQSAAVEQARVTRLSPVNVFFQSVNGRVTSDGHALAGSVDWRAVIQQVAAHMPAGSELTGFSVSAATPAPAAGTATASSTSSAVVSATGSTVTMNVTARGGVDAVATWLRAMGEVPFLTNVWVASSTVTATGTSSVTFVCTASLTDKAPVQHPTLGGRS